MLEILFLDLEDYDEMLLEHLSYQWDTIIDLFELKIESIQNKLQVLTINYTLASLGNHIHTQT